MTARGPGSPRLLRVALSFPLRPGPWPDVVRGAYEYAGRDRPWHVTLHNDEDPAAALATRPHGVLAMVRTAEAAARFAAWGGPVVDTAHDLDAPFVRVGVDALAVGRLAADHLLALNRPSHGFVGTTATPAGRLAHRGFAERLHAAGVAPPATLSPIATAEQMAEWLGELPRPAAVFAADDALAHRLAEACRAAGVRVPEDVALLGCLNDEFLCTASLPPLSSVSAPLVIAGFEAARLLDTMMAGKKPPVRHVTFAPLGIITRRSTDATVVADPDLAAALRFIRDHATERIGVPEIAAATGLSRSSLERRFRAVVGHGPLAELLRERIERAKQLLTTTGLPVKEVARQTGFRDVRHLSVLFRQKTGESPVRYRGRHRPA